LAWKKGTALHGEVRAGLRFTYSADKTTVKDVIRDIERRFGILQILFAADKSVRLSVREAVAAVKSIAVAELDLNGEKQLLVSSRKAAHQTRPSSVETTALQAHRLNQETQSIGRGEKRM